MRAPSGCGFARGRRFGFSTECILTPGRAPLERAPRTATIRLTCAFKGAAVRFDVLHDARWVASVAVIAAEAFRSALRQTKDSFQSFGWPNLSGGDSSISTRCACAIGACWASDDVRFAGRCCATRRRHRSLIHFPIEARFWVI